MLRELLKLGHPFLISVRLLGILPKLLALTNRVFIDI